MIKTAITGFGEVGGIFAKDLAAEGCSGIEPLPSRAIAERQDWAWRQSVAMGAARNEPALDTLLDAMAAATLAKAAE